MEAYKTLPSVTVVVPVRNGEQTIQPLLESLQKLDYDRNKMELIVDDEMWPLPKYRELLFTR